MNYAILFALFGTCIAYEPLSQSKVLEFADTQLHSGPLKRSNDFLYVDVDDAWIHAVAPLIKEEGFTKPPYFGNDLVGAHISVAFPAEINNGQEIIECGTKIDFIPRGCAIVRLNKPSTHLPNVTEVYVLIVDAPTLDQIREQYQLPKLPYPFHITLGVK